MHTNEKECNLATPPPAKKMVIACLKFPNFLKTFKFIFHIDCILPFSTSAQSAFERHVQTRNLFNYQIDNAALVWNPDSINNHYQTVTHNGFVIFYCEQVNYLVYTEVNVIRVPKFKSGPIRLLVFPKNVFRNKNFKQIFSCTTNKFSKDFLGFLQYHNLRLKALINNNNIELAIHSTHHVNR